MADEGGFDMDAAVDGIGAELFDAQPEDTPIEPPAETAPAEPAPTEPVAPEIAMPASWAKEHAEAWTKMPKPAQEYYIQREKQMLDGMAQNKEYAGFGKQLRELMAPFKPLLEQQGIDEFKAVQYLLSAHQRLSAADANSRRDYFSQLAKSYGIDLTQTAVQVDPQVKALQDKIERLEAGFTSREQATLAEAKGRIEKEVATFAADAPYFEEVADDIVAMIQTGADLKTAYDKAVWANPVTRQKEIARLQQENEAKLKDKAKSEAEAARKAAGSNIRSRDTRRAPTEPLGTMEDTMQSTLNEIHQRAH